MAYKKMNSLRMEPAGNGVVLSWEEQHESPMAGQTYTNTQYKNKKEVFEIDHGKEGDEGMDNAMKRYRELFMKHHAEQNANK